MLLLTWGVRSKERSALITLIEELLRVNRALCAEITVLRCTSASPENCQENKTRSLQC